MKKKRDKQLGKSKKGVDEGSQKSDTSDVGAGAKAKVNIYQEKLGDVPLLGFLDNLKQRDRMAVLAMIEELERQGHTMRPPQNEHLGDQIYYLRVSGQDGEFRVFYFPHGKATCILGHGYSKKTRKCPPEELKRARRMRDRFEANPACHTYEEAYDGDQEDE